MANRTSGSRGEWADYVRQVGGTICLGLPGGVVEEGANACAVCWAVTTAGLCQVVGEVRWRLDRLARSRSMWGPHALWFVRGVRRSGVEC